jgi:hypothetical protein
MNVSIKGSQHIFEIVFNMFAMHRIGMAANKNNYQQRSRS